jgi:hypothetical protein
LVEFAFVGFAFSMARMILISISAGMIAASVQIMFRTSAGNVGKRVMVVGVGVGLRVGPLFMDSEDSERESMALTYGAMVQKVDGTKVVEQTRGSASGLMLLKGRFRSNERMNLLV